jgi:ubiquinone/menaquinone biosynthesis C-methylase UbiE
MTPSDAAALIRTPLAGSVWADLGCGTGTFTRALATLLTQDAVIHAIDTDASALRSMPAQYDGCAIKTHVADFTRLPWPFGDVDGVLLANSLHYVRDQQRFVTDAARHINGRQFLIVEYDTLRANPWVPYPLDRASLDALFRVCGFTSFTWLGTRKSIYRRAPLYGALVSA